MAAATYVLVVSIFVMEDEFLLWGLCSDLIDNQLANFPEFR